MTIRAPDANPVLMPPAALVSTTVLTPNTPITRTANVTVRSSWPSYAWQRPARAAIVRPFTRPTTRRPSCPTTREAGQCGSCSYGIDTASAGVPAKSPNPEPSTIATLGTSLICERTASAASFTWS